MKPIKLTLSAFGPYADKTVIDMESLGDAGLYLITGDTGSGKTTIFDGISYALYGKASGDNRENSMLRSKYARDETPTFVEMEFLYQGKSYTVRRNPEYQRPKARGEGYTTEPARGSLTFPDGRPPLTKTGEINAAIVDLLGLEKDQFAQIAMIAQGDFLRLLLAKTDTRREIFRKIFKTKPYEAFQRKMNRHAIHLENEYSDLQKSLEQYLSGVTWEEGDPLGEMIGQAQEDSALWPMEETVSRIERLISQDREYLKTADGQWNRLDRELTRVNQQIGEWNRIKELKDELVAKRKMLEAEMPNLEKVAARYGEEEKNKPKIEKLTTIITSAKDRLDRYDRLEELTRSLVHLQKGLDTAEKNVRILGAEGNKLKMQLEEDENILQSLADVPQEKSTLENEAGRLQQREADLLGLQRSLAELGKKEKDLENAQKKYREASDLYFQTEKEVMSMERAFLDSQAGILAKKLVEDEACPVCGSLTHPSPAETREDAPTENQLQSEKKKLKELRLISERRSKEANLLLGEINQARENLRKLGEQLLGTGEEISVPLIPALDKVKDQVRQTAQALEEAEKKMAEKKNLEESIPSIREKMEARAKQVEEKNEERIQMKERIGATEKRIAEERKELPHPSKDDAKEEIRKLEGSKEVTEAAIRQAEEAYRSVTKKVDEGKAAITALEGQVSKQSSVDGESLLLSKENLEKERSMLDQERTAVKERYRGNLRILEDMGQKRAEISKVEEERRWVKSLSDTVNAKVSGKEKIMLETYVQMTYFDRIISRANVRFMKMSSGQYEMKRRVVAGNFQSQSGLELDIIDHYNGTERQAASLSGGESFMASLSLALGLSEEIQTSAGGIKLDTMFVDEGFGSLDESSLGHAMKSLRDLSEGHRLVGIISHVGELKDMIDKQIVVTKEKSGGSRVEIVL